MTAIQFITTQPPQRNKGEHAQIDMFSRRLTLTLSVFLPAVVITLVANFYVLAWLAPMQAHNGFDDIMSFPAAGEVKRKMSSPLRGDSYDRENDDGFFSACLMVMDDNHRLVEWIAYHYFTLKMRRLIVVQDPKSIFLPTSILDRWRPYMEIEEWHDEDWMEEDLYNKSLEVLNDSNSGIAEAHDHHMERQSRFLQTCVTHMKNKNSTWVGAHDVDEYYVLNEDLVKNAPERMKQPNSVLQVLNDVQRMSKDFSNKFSGGQLFSRFGGPCVTTSRVHYGAVESTDQEIYNGVPSFLNPKKFETLRWRHHCPPDRCNKWYTNGKSLIDVSMVDLNNTWKDRPDNPFKNRIDLPFSMHRMLPCCPDTFGYDPQGFIRLLHYVGSWEYYSFRQNDRRKGGRKSMQRYKQDSSQQGGKNGDEARPWIEGFVHLFGEELAKELLADAGLPDNYTAPSKESWDARKMKH